MRFLFLIFAFLISLPLYAQDTISTVPCSAPAYSALDFWIGEWDVYGEDTLPIATCTMQKRLGNCVLFGEWDFEGIYTTQFTCRFDDALRTWKGHSEDSEGLEYIFPKAEMQSNAVVFFTENKKEKFGTNFMEKMEIKRLENGDVQQHGSKSKDKGGTWNTEYSLTYKRRNLNVPDEKLRTELGADDYGMRQYVMAFLKKGPNRDRTKEESAKLQAAHMENIGRMAEAGDLIVAGPFLDDGDIRGIYIFNVKTVEEARKLTETDPAIQAGSLIMELHPWYGSAALMKLAEFEGRLQKKGF